MKTRIGLSCARCHEELVCEANLEFDEDGDPVVRPGTLRNNWVIRWTKAHMDPSVFVVA